VVCDVSQEADCARLVAETRAAYGPCEVLVNNAALSHNVPVLEYPVNRWLRAWAVSFHGPFMLSRLVLPEMIERRAGAIVNITSGRPVINGPGRGPYAGRARSPGGPMYGPMKAALERFTQELALEVYGHGISVTALGPSRPVATPVALERNVLESVHDPRGEPPEVMARAVVALATAPLDRVTGRVTYSQAILKELTGLGGAVGPGVDEPGSFYAES
jgi:NAD(P)-dependent dehydrogenase (short-subunit alcohol dehydrogenase family)